MSDNKKRITIKVKQQTFRYYYRADAISKVRELLDAGIWFFTVEEDEKEVDKE